MTAYHVEHLERIVDYLRDKRGEEVSLADVVSLAEITAESLQTFFETMDRAVYRELREIAEYIAGMKREIGALQVNDLKESRIPAAGQELDAIVKATEKATNTIMSVAEDIMATDASDPAAYKTFVDERMLVIFEACSFQDITGQRIAKVCETLQAIEHRVARFAEATRAKDAAGFLTEEEARKAERRERLLLHGPMLEGTGVSQTDVDAMIGEATPAPKAAAAPAKPAPAPAPAAAPKAAAKPAAAPAPKPAPAPAEPAAAPAGKASQADIDALFA